MPDRVELSLHVRCRVKRLQRIQTDPLGQWHPPAGERTVREFPWAGQMGEIPDPETMGEGAGSEGRGGVLLIRFFLELVATCVHLLGDACAVQTHLLQLDAEGLRISADPGGARGMVTQCREELFQAVRGVPESPRERAQLIGVGAQCKHGAMIGEGACHVDGENCPSPALVTDARTVAALTGSALSPGGPTAAGRTGGGDRSSAALRSAVGDG